MAEAVAATQQKREEEYTEKKRDLYNKIKLYLLLLQEKMLMSSEAISVSGGCFVGGGKRLKDLDLDKEESERSN